MKQKKNEISGTRSAEFSRLKGHPHRAQCSKCGSKRSYTNPMTICYECRKKICYDHVFSGQINDGMGENDSIRDVCAICKKLKGYRDM
jgi:hypothetical protein